MLAGPGYLCPSQSRENLSFGIYSSVSSFFSNSVFASLYYVGQLYLLVLKVVGLRRRGPGTLQHNPPLTRTRYSASLVCMGCVCPLIVAEL